jgi:hypothetical protein
MPTLEDAKHWRKLAGEVRAYADEIAKPEARDEMIRAAENWERKAAEVEEALNIINNAKR